MSTETSGEQAMPASPAPINRTALAVQIILSAAVIFGVISLGYTMADERGDYVTPMWVLYLHLATAATCVPLGAFILWGPKGTPRHKMLGRIWLSLMLITAIASVFVRTLTGGFSPIHIFSVLTFISVPLAIWRIRKGDVAGHRRTLIGLYIGLIAAGAFAMLPGRFIWYTLFG